MGLPGTALLSGILSSLGAARLVVRVRPQIIGDIPDFLEMGTGLTVLGPCRDSIVLLPQSKTRFRKANEDIRFLAFVIPQA